MSTVNHRKLLLIACSNRKLRAAGLVPALERYDGVTYRVIRKAQREGYFPENVDIKILSAEFGLIDAATPIPYYDRRMDRKRAEQLRTQVQEDLHNCLSEGGYSEIYVDLGEAYLPAIGSFPTKYEGNLTRAGGTIGVRLGNLKRWLRVSRGYVYDT